MNSDDYIKNVLKTESADYEKIKQRIATRRMVRLLHGAIGKVTEAAELIDQLKKCIFYGKDLDVFNIIEEIGDGNWYDAIILDEIKSSFDRVWELNLSKLEKRYGSSFNEEKAANRNLVAEKEILEEKWREVCCWCKKPVGNERAYTNFDKKIVYHESCFFSKRKAEAGEKDAEISEAERAEYTEELYDKTKDKVGEDLV